MTNTAIIRKFGTTTDCGREVDHCREVKLSYVKGRGVCLGVWTVRVGGGFHSYDLFGDNNTQAVILPLKRGNPALLRKMFARIEAKADDVFSVLGADWHHKDRDETERKAIIQAIAALARGDAESIAA